MVHLYTNDLIPLLFLFLRKRFSRVKFYLELYIYFSLMQYFVDFVAVAARIREILENVGLAQESLPSNVVSSAQVLANVANFLNIRDTELSRWDVILDTKLHLCSCLFNVTSLNWRNANSFLVAMGDLSLRKTGVEEKRAKVQKESKILLDYTRKAIARLTYLKRYFIKTLTSISLLSTL